MDLSWDWSGITFSAGRRQGSAAADLPLINQSKTTAAFQFTHTLYLVVMTVTQARGVDSAKAEVWQGHLTAHTANIQTQKAPV